MNNIRVQDRSGINLAIQGYPFLCFSLLYRQFVALLTGSQTRSAIHSCHAITLTRPTTFHTNKRHEINEIHAHTHYMRVLVRYDKIVIISAQSSNDMEG